MKTARRRPGDLPDTIKAEDLVAEDRGRVPAELMVKFQAATAE
jgi:hypothetical protein